MTVNELVQLLGSYPADMRVVVDGYEEGYDDLSPEQLCLVRIGIGTGKHHWEGLHNDADNLSSETLANAEVEKVLALHRTSH